MVGELFQQLHHAALPRTLDIHSRLDADLGFDSLARVELLSRLERTLQLEIPQEAFGSLDTIADLLQVLTSAPGKAGAAGARAPAVTATQGRSALLGGEPADAGTLTEVLLWRAQRHPQATHTIMIGERESEVLDYATLLASARTISAGLSRYGLSPGTPVALMLPTSIGYLQTFFGVLLSGAIPVPLYPPASRAQLEEHVRRHGEILSNAGAEALITFHQAGPVARLLKSRVPALRHVLSISELARSGRLQPLPSGLSADSIALLQYTSGSTGSPKGVVLTHRQLLANIRAMGAAIDASDRDVFVSWLPLYHDMGLIGAWLGSLYYGCLLVLMPPSAFLSRPVRWLRAIHDYRGTISASPNFGYELTARRPIDEELEGLDLSCLRITFNGAEPVYAETLERFHRRFSPYGLRQEVMTPVYGLAEAGVGVTFPPCGRGPLVDHVERDALALRREALPAPGRTGAQVASQTLTFVSCGRPLPGYRLRVVDAGGAELGERMEGDLQFAGPSATSGYYRNADATAALLCGEWRNTGDRAYLAGAELYITGRAKDVVIRRGRHFHPEEIESSIGNADGVRRGCVVAFGTREAETGTERLVVVAETHEAEPARRREIKADIVTRVTAAIGEPPDEVVLVEPHTVLKTSSGKLRRAATRQAYLDGSLGTAAPGPLLQWIRLTYQNGLQAARHRLDAAGRFAFGLYAWCVLVGVGVPVILLSIILRRPATIWRLNHRAARVVLSLLQLPIQVSWQTSQDLPRPHIIVANHSSYVDNLVMAALLSQPHRFAAKAELDQVPVLRRYLRRLRTLFIERFVPGQSIAALSSLQEALRDGDSVVVFPEGTFTATTGLRPFYLGAFQAAVAAHVPVICVALRGTRSVLRDGQWWPQRRPVGVVIGAALRSAANEEPFAAAVSLRDAARSQILRYCGELDLE